MNEQRREERKILIKFTPVYDLRNNNLLGYFRDLTIHGAKLVGNKLVEIDKKLPLAIEFPATPEIPSTRMTIPTRVTWCKPEENSSSYNTGVEFLELSDQNKMVIAAILERYQFRQELSA